jgi:hypothetical protein
VLSRILGVPDYVHSLSQFCVIDIQRIIAALWAPFLSHPEGILASDFAKVNETLGGNAPWLTNWVNELQSVVRYTSAYKLTVCSVTNIIDGKVAPRPSYLAQVDPPVSLRYPATWG